MNHYMSLSACVLSAAVLCSCSGNIITQDSSAKKPATGESWTVMVYMCGGSDEHLYGKASKALKEMTQVQYPENLNVVIETGGSLEWHTEGIDTNYIDRFEAQSGSLKLIERAENTGMVQQSALTDFLEWGKENYESNHYALILYGSGANSAYGALHDETNGNNSMSSARLASAVSDADIKLDILGFDADLMASIETAELMSDCADYLIASQETMAADSWNYRDWLNYIIENPTASVVDISTAACDTYMDKCARQGTDEMATMSVTELSGITTLTQAVDTMAGEMISSFDSLSGYSKLSAASENIMSFGSCSVDEGFSNMSDINDLAAHVSAAAEKTSGRVQEKLSEAVLYRANGEFRSQACGLSIFYPLNQSSDELPRYMDISPLSRYKEYVARICANASHGTSVSADAKNTTAYKDFERECELLSHETVAGTTGIELNMIGDMNVVRSVKQRIFMKEDGKTLYLGKTSDVDENREAGIYKSKNDFRFPMINNHNLSWQTVYESDSCSIYTAPVKLDGTQKNLRIAQYKTDNGKIKYKFLGVRDSLGAGSKSSRNTDSIMIYNLITPMYRDYASGSLTDGKSFKTWPFGMNISSSALKDGDYLTDYAVEYIYGGGFTSGSADFSCADNTLTYK